jgi:hypothetical protein
MSIKIKVQLKNKPQQSNLLKDCFPKLYKEIHPTKNPCVNIDMLTCGSHQKIWWICSQAKCGHHVWQSMVRNRTRGSRCIFCYGTGKSKKTCICDSFGSLYPELVKEFDEEKNQGIDPYARSKGSNIKCWWKCHKVTCSHHLWEASICDRTSGHGCPFCAGQKTSSCESFGTLYPKILLQFDWEKNKGSDPYGISPGSKQYPPCF